MGSTINQDNNELVSISKWLSTNFGANFSVCSGTNLGWNSISISN
jgi:hypothetical protein